MRIPRKINITERILPTLPNIKLPATPIVIPNDNDRIIPPIKDTSLIAGDGLTDTVGVLSVNVDNTTLEITSDVLNVKDGGITNAKIPSLAGIDVSKLANGTVSNTEFETLNFITSNIQTQINTKQDIITAGDGLLLTGATLSARVDNTTLEITSDVLNVKASGIGTTQLAANAVTTAKITDGNVTLAKLANGTVDDQVITYNGGSIAWRYPMIFHTVDFSSSTALASGATSLGINDRISSVATYKVPSGFMLLVLASVGAMYTGGTAGTYSLALVLNNKTDGTTTTLATAETTSVNSTTHMNNITGTLAAPIVTLTENKEWSLGFKNVSAPGPVGTVHDMYIIFVLVPLG